MNIFILLQQKGVQIDLIFSPFFQFHEKQKTKKLESSHQKHISIKNNGNGQIFTAIYTKLILYFKIYKCLKIVRGVVGGCISKMRRERERELTKSGNRISVECLPNFFFFCSPYCILKFIFHINIFVANR